MKVKDLVAFLSTQNPEAEVVRFDGEWGDHKRPIFKTGDQSDVDFVKHECKANGKDGVLNNPVDDTIVSNGLVVIS